MTEFDLQKILPQAFPFIMIDRIIEFEEGKSLKAVKNVTANEWLFDDHDHFVEYFPETLLIEMAAQAAVLLYKLSKTHLNASSYQFILGKIKADFKNSVKIGDQLDILSYAKRMQDQLGYMENTIKVNKKVVANIELFYSIKN